MNYARCLISKDVYNKSKVDYCQRPKVLSDFFTSNHQEKWGTSLFDVVPTKNKASKEYNYSSIDFQSSSKNADKFNKSYRE